MLLFAKAKLSTCFLFALLTFALGMATAADSRALEPATPLSRLGRQSWTMENGLPQNTVPVLLQSRSGYLWAGTELGLARFDGTSFRIFDHSTPQFPDAEIRCLLDAADGSLWVGTGDGLVRLNQGQTRLFTSHDGLPDNSIRALAQTTDGTIWIWTEAGLARSDGTHFTGLAAEAVSSAGSHTGSPAGSPAGSPRGQITSIAADSAGALWVGTSAGVSLFRGGQWQPKWRTPDGESNSIAGPGLVVGVAGGDVLIAQGGSIVEDHAGSVRTITPRSAPANADMNFLTRLADGTVAAASNSSLILLSSSRTSPGQVLARYEVARQLPGSRIESLFADREGCLWVGTNHGLARIAMEKSVPSLQLLPPTDPLAANAVVAFIEDREGDLWIGTETGGLHILRDARFRILGTSDGLSSDATTAIVQDASNRLWIGTRDSGLNRIDHGVTTNLTTANGLLSNVILALAAAPNGDLWVGTPDGLNKIPKGRVSSFTSADGLPDDFIRSLLVAPDGSVWIGTRRGLTHLDHGRFQNLMQPDGLGSNLVGALARTANGDLWIATLNGLSRMSKGKLHNYTTTDGLSSNVITALDVTPDGILWIGTQGDGLNLWDGKRFEAIRAAAFTQTAAQPDLIPKAIHAILHDDVGHLWLASDQGLTRADAAGLLQCAESSPCSANLANFTTNDGLRSRETSSNSHPTALRTEDGQLWFTTPRGVIVVDPLHFADAPGPPPVVIERFAIDDLDYHFEYRDRQPDSRIAAGHLRFQFDYTGLSFAAPQKLRYQYMLEGFDHSWTDAGTRRTAYYTNIPPGTYHFRVRAALSDASFATDGPGRAAEASLTFELLPHFYQTVWFRALVVLLVLALVLLVFRRRVLRVEREFRAVMAERNRIAREIHDTLAQGYVGISLQLEILGELLRHNRRDAAEKHLAVTQELVRDGLNDARQTIWALRSQDSAEQTLPIRLRRIVEQTQDASLTANLEVHGAYRALTPDTEMEILRIAQEAVQNVKRHAAATRMSVRLDYDDRELMLSVSDNGQGFARTQLHPDGTVIGNAAEGHYGLTGMKERAALIQGSIEIVSSPAAGTMVRLRVPASEARKSGTAHEAVGTGKDS